MCDSLFGEFLSEDEFCKKMEEELFPLDDNTEQQQIEPSIQIEQQMKPTIVQKPVVTKQSVPRDEKAYNRFVNNLRYDSSVEQMADKMMSYSNELLRLLESGARKNNNMFVLDLVNHEKIRRENKKVFKREDDILLLKFVQKYGTYWYPASRLLQKSPMQCKIRYETLWKSYK